MISDEYISYIENAASEYHLCPEMIEAIIEHESSGQANAINGSCKGLMQVNVPYHMERMHRLGVSNIYDPYSNIVVGCDYLAELFEEYDDIGTVLMVYNGSSNAIDRGEAGKYTDYAEKIIERSMELERLHNK